MKAATNLDQDLILGGLIPLLARSQGTASGSEGFSDILKNLCSKQSAVDRKATESKEEPRRTRPNANHSRSQRPTSKSIGKTEIGPHRKAENAGSPSSPEGAQEALAETDGQETINKASSNGLTDEKKAELLEKLEKLFAECDQETLSQLPDGNELLAFLESLEDKIPDDLKNLLAGNPDTLLLLATLSKVMESKPTETDPVEVLEDLRKDATIGQLFSGADVKLLQKVLTVLETASVTDDQDSRDRIAPISRDNKHHGAKPGKADGKKETEDGTGDDPDSSSVSNPGSEETRETRRGTGKKLEVNAPQAATNQETEEVTKNPDKISFYPREKSEFLQALTQAAHSSTESGNVLPQGSQVSSSQPSTSFTDQGTRAPLRDLQLLRVLANSGAPSGQGSESGQNQKENGSKNPLFSALRAQFRTEGFVGDGNPKSSSSAPRFTDPIRATLYSQIIEKADFFKGSEQTKVMSIQLKPETLGKLDLELSSKNGTVTAHICAESAMVKEKLEQILPQIRENLASQGVDIQQIVVDISSQNPDDRKGHSFHGETPRFKGHNDSIESESAETSTDILPEIRNLALNIRSVDITI